MPLCNDIDDCIDTPLPIPAPPPPDPTPGCNCDFIEPVDELPETGEINVLYYLPDGTMYVWDDSQDPAVWLQVGGGSAIVPVQTIGTSITDVMSQDATTKMVFPGVNPLAANAMIGIGKNITGTGGDAVAIGNGVLVGSNANSWAVAIGGQALGGDRDVAIGGVAKASNANTVAIGFAAEANPNRATVVGSSSIADSGSANTSILGFNSHATAAGNSVLLGSLTTNSGRVDVASVGSNTLKRPIINVGTPTQPDDAATKAYVDSVASAPVQVPGNDTTVVMSQNASTLMIYNDPSIRNIVAITKSGGSFGTDSTTVSGGSSGAARGNNSVAIGNSAATQSSAVNGTAVGPTARANNAAASAFGSSSDASAQSSTALGQGAEVIVGADLGVALGAASRATVAQTVSVGQPGLLRRIMNVANPVDPQDAVTKSYADAASSAPVTMNGTWATNGVFTSSNITNTADLVDGRMYNGIATTATLPTATGNNTFITIGATPIQVYIYSTKGTAGALNTNIIPILADTFRRSPGLFTVKYYANQATLVGFGSGAIFVVQPTASLGVDLQSGNFGVYGIPVNGTLTVQNGGTGITSVVSGKVLVGTGAGTIAQQFVKNYSGQVKVTYTGLSSTNFVAGTTKLMPVHTATPTVVASPTTTWPFNSPTTYDPGMWIPGATPATTGRLRENNLNGQVHRWRLRGTYAGKATTNNGQLQLRLRNPSSGFIIPWQITLPDDLATGDWAAELTTIADPASLGAGLGYVLEATTSFTDINFNVTVTDITRDSTANENALI